MISRPAVHVCVICGLMFVASAVNVGGQGPTGHSPRRVFHEDALALQLHEKLSPCSDGEAHVRRHTHSHTHTLQGRGLALTAQVLQDEIELPSGLEGVD